MNSEPQKDYLVKEDYQYNVFYDFDCPVCYISSFSHFHKKGTLPKDFERNYGQPEDEAKFNKITLSKLPERDWQKDLKKAYEERDVLEIFDIADWLILKEQQRCVEIVNETYKNSNVYNWQEMHEKIIQKILNQK